jgi:hypothetical protein
MIRWPWCLSHRRCLEIAHIRARIGVVDLHGRIV